MATQGATLRRGTAHAPIWPVAALITAVVAAVITIQLIDTQGPATRLENPGVVTDTRALFPSLAAREASNAAVREQGATLPAVVGISHVTPRATYVTIQGTTMISGLENPGAYPDLGSDGVFTPTMGSRPGYGANCGQCR